MAAGVSPDDAPLYGNGETRFVSTAAVRRSDKKELLGFRSTGLAGAASVRVAGQGDRRHPLDSRWAHVSKFIVREQNLPRLDQNQNFDAKLPQRFKTYFLQNGPKLELFYSSQQVAPHPCTFQNGENPVFLYTKCPKHLKCPQNRLPGTTLCKVQCGLTHQPGPALPLSVVPSIAIADQSPLPPLANRVDIDEEAVDGRLRSGGLEDCSGDQAAERPKDAGAKGVRSCPGPRPHWGAPRDVVRVMGQLTGVHSRGLSALDPASQADDRRPLSGREGAISGALMGSVWPTVGARCRGEVTTQNGHVNTMWPPSRTGPSNTHIHTHTHMPLVHSNGRGLLLAPSLLRTLLPVSSVFHPS